MARGDLERNTFIRGLITEATALTFPENASIDEDNMVLNRDGSRQRRLGMDYEDSAVVTDTGEDPLTFDNFYVGSTEWKNVNNSATVSFGVVQIGNELWFVDLFADTLSTAILNGGVPVALDEATIGKDISGLTKLSIAPVNGSLIVTSEELTLPLLFEYSEEDDEFAVSDIILEVRDIWGVYDTLNTDERPPTLETDHQYNLLNQGWPSSKITADFEGVTGLQSLSSKYPSYYTTAGVIRYPTTVPTGGGRGFRASVAHTQAVVIYNKYGTDGTVLVSATGTGYPSNADLVSLGKKSDGTFDSTLIEGSFFGTTPAPKGLHVIDAFDRGASRETKSGLSDLDVDQEQSRPAVVESFANRVFYSGIDSIVLDPTETSVDYTGTVLFSQVIETFSQLGRCYQDADPTAEDISDLVSTDGGTIKITGASLVRRMIATSTSLVVFADNGVWEITGPDGVFKADDFSINQVSNIGVISADAIVDAEGQIFYWSRGGVYQLVPDEISGRFNAKNITETTIQTLYNDIPTVGKANAVSNYDPGSRKIRWLYNDTDAYDGITRVNEYNRELIFDTVLQAFYSSTLEELATDSPYAAGFLVTEDFLTEDFTQDVVVGGVQVQVNTVDVTQTTQVRSRGDSQTKYLTIKPNSTGSNYGFTFSQFRDTAFLDWISDDATGLDAPAFLITGQELFGDTQRKKQVPYFTAHFVRTETGFTDTGAGLDLVGGSSCLVTARWDFADTTAGGKFGTQFEAYRISRFFLPADENDAFDYGQSVITTKSKLRGKGRALSLRIDTAAGKDLHMLGWALNVQGQDRV